MPSNVELARRIERLEAWSDDKLEEIASKLIEKCKSKLQAPELEISKLKSEVESLVTGVNGLKALVEELRSENAALVSSNKLLKKQNDTLTKRVSELEQYSRLNNVELKGLPCSQGEDCTAIVKAMATKINCTVNDSDIDVIHRVPTKTDSNKNIIVRFCSRDKKQEFLGKARKAKLHTNDLGFPGPRHNPVFANDHLTPDNKRLFAKALSQKREKGWAYLWTENCLIKARQSSESRVYRIRTEADLSVFR
ncbi:hypothetical protein HPB50_006810 [Hyalomma asiaticum]|uniref:Uncharacterized protein n=1 Tax=Hyalomma asiaticum TaxID=266040 RepID=A0ACB7S0V3_HYAAI|nr:hypothetical protein HPB50_006810 [Hyalomma asiaticum]